MKKSPVFFILWWIICLIYFSEVFGQNTETCMVVGHRGSSKVAPENTISAARLAWDQGAHAVEVDVHLSADNQIVVIHDKGTKRTTGEDYEVSKTPYEMLKRLDAGSWKNEKYKGEKIPVLSDIVDMIPEGKYLVVEIKSDRKIVPFIQKAFQHHEKVNQLIFIAFDYETICDAKQAFPDNKSLWLSSSFKKDAETILQKVKKDKLDGVDLNYRMIDPKLMEIAEGLGLEVHTWTVNDLNKAMELKKMGVKSITTDIPDHVLEAIQ